MYRILIVSGVIAAAASTSNAGFTFTSQFRSIRAEASAALGAVVDERSMNAIDFGLFTQSADAEAFDPQTGARGWGYAHMDSHLEPLRVLAQGGWSGGRNGQGGRRRWKFEYLGWILA
jgi:hypothetical protein